MGSAQGIRCLHGSLNSGDIGLTYTVAIILRVVCDQELGAGSEEGSEVNNSEFEQLNSQDLLVLTFAFYSHLYKYPCCVCVNVCVWGRCTVNRWSRRESELRGFRVAMVPSSSGGTHRKCPQFLLVSWSLVFIC